MQVCVEQRSISDLSSRAKKAVPGIASATEMPPPGTGVPFPWPLLGKRKIKTKQDMTRAKHREPSVMLRAGMAKQEAAACPRPH